MRTLIASCPHGHYALAMDTTVWSVAFFLIIFGGLAWMTVTAIRKGKEQQAENAHDGVVAALPVPGGSLRLTTTELIEGYGDTARRHPLAGLTASVEDSGTVNRRLTATRLVALGPLALAAPKKLDDRELYVSIQGPGVAIVKAIPLKNAPRVGQQARAFVMQLNQQAMALSE